MKTKLCTHCKIDKNLSDFYRLSVGPSGRQYRCKACMALAQKNNREKINKRRIKWRLKNHDKALVKDRQFALSHMYGISVKDYDDLHKKQGGLCAICRKPNRNTFRGVIRRLAVDHNHKTDEIRGLLCSSCNLAIGLFKEEIPILTSAISYLSNGGFR